MRRKFWLYVTGIVATLAGIGFINWNTHNFGIVLATSLLTFCIGTSLGTWYTRQLREARARGEVW